MTNITLELIHQDILEVKRDLKLLKDCFHEDFLELNEKTKTDIELSRKQIRQGKIIKLKDL